MKVHTLKTLPGYFESALQGRKTFGVRKNDREYKVGDILVLKEWDGHNYTLRMIRGIARYILTDESEGVKKGFVVMELENLQYFKNGFWHTILNNTMKEEYYENGKYRDCEEHTAGAECI